MWKYDGSKRPTFATQPRTAQESVWDYPRPLCCSKTQEGWVSSTATASLLKVHGATVYLRPRAHRPSIFPLLTLISNNCKLWTVAQIVNGKVGPVTGPSNAMTRWKCLHGATLNQLVLFCRLKIISLSTRVASIVLLTTSGLNLKTVAFTEAGSAMRSSAHGKVVRGLATGRSIKSVWIYDSINCA